MVKSINVNGREYQYSDSTKFDVQVGKGKSAYKTRYSFTGDLRQAAFYYHSLNIGNGYKKRLLLDGKTLVRG